MFHVGPPLLAVKIIKLVSSLCLSGFVPPHSQYVSVDSEKTIQAKIHRKKQVLNKKRKKVFNVFMRFY